MVLDGPGDDMHDPVVHKLDQDGSPPGAFRDADGSQDPGPTCSPGPKGGVHLVQIKLKPHLGKQAHAR